LEGEGGGWHESKPTAFVREDKRLGHKTTTPGWAGVTKPRGKPPPHPPEVQGKRGQQRKVDKKTQGSARQRGRYQCQTGGGRQKLNVSKLGERKVLDTSRKEKNDRRPVCVYMVRGGGVGYVSQGTVTTKDRKEIGRSQEGGKKKTSLGR